jgi:hypothetical protein
MNSTPPDMANLPAQDNMNPDIEIQNEKTQSDIIDKNGTAVRSDKKNENQTGNPPLRIVAILMVALYLAMFLVALVRPLRGY